MKSGIKDPDEECHTYNELELVDKGSFDSQVIECDKMTISNVHKHFSKDALA